MSRVSESQAHRKRPIRLEAAGQWPKLASCHVGALARGERSDVGLSTHDLWTIRNEQCAEADGCAARLALAVIQRGLEPGGAFFQADIESRAHAAAASLLVLIRHSI